MWEVATAVLQEREYNSTTYAEAGGCLCPRETATNPGPVKDKDDCDGLNSAEKGTLSQDFERPQRKQRSRQIICFCTEAVSLSREWEHWDGSSD